MTVRKRAILAGLCVTATVGFYILACGRIVLNGSGSLPHNAYFMVTWPKLVHQGVYAALEMPPALRPRLGDIALVKQIQGLPGDVIEHKHGAACIGSFCAAPEVRDGQPVFDVIPAQTIPDGSFAAFGTSANSLDSRYAVIGLFSHGDVIAVGFPIAFPHWTEVRAWLDG